MVAAASHLSFPVIGRRRLTGRRSVWTGHRGPMIGLWTAGTIAFIAVEIALADITSRSELFFGSRFDVLLLIGMAILVAALLNAATLTLYRGIVRRSSITDRRLG